MKQKRSWRGRLRWGLAFLGAGLALWWLLTPGKRPLPIDAATTWVTGPLDEDGYVDFVAALNAHHAVAADDNAMVLLWDAIGLRPEGHPVAADFFRLIGRAAPGEDDGFVQLDAFARRCGADDAEASEGLEALQEGPWRVEDAPAAAEWLEENGPALARAVEASRRRRYYAPLIVSHDAGVSLSMISALLPWVQTTRELGRALVVRAMARAGVGDIDGAWQDLLACLRLARLMTQGSTGIEGLVGWALERIANRGMLALVRHARPDAARLEAMLRDLRALPPPNPLADKIDWGERLMFLDVAQLTHRHGSNYLQVIADGKVKEPHLLGGAASDLGETMREGNALYTQLAEALRATTRAERVRGVDAVADEVGAIKMGAVHWTSLFWLHLGGPRGRGPRVGALVIGLMAPAGMILLDAEDRNRQGREMLLVAIALEAHRRRAGAYPAGLAALGPVPRDVFDDTPLRYSREGDGYVLWSVGVDGRAEPGADDLTVRMPGG